MNFEYFLIRITFLKIKKKIIKFYIEFVQMFFSPPSCSFCIRSFRYAHRVYFGKKNSLVFGTISHLILYFVRVCNLSSAVKYFVSRTLLIRVWYIVQLQKMTVDVLLKKLSFQCFQCLSNISSAVIFLCWTHLHVHIISHHTYIIQFYIQHSFYICRR